MVDAESHHSKRSHSGSCTCDGPVMSGCVKPAFVLLLVVLTILVVGYNLSRLDILAVRLGGSSASKHTLGISDTCKVALLDSLQRQRGDQCSSDTGTILSGGDFDRVVFLSALLLGPIEDLTEGNSTSGLEVGVLVEYGTVGTNVSSLVTLLLTDSGNTTGREAGGTGSN